MPRWARSSARCGPTPLIMRTSVPRFIAIGERTEFIGRILFISFPQRRYGSCATCTVGVRTDRVRFRVLNGEGPLAGEQLSRLEESSAWNVSGYRSAVAFNVDDEAKTYLERELDLRQANQLMSSDLHVWYWEVRFFRPQQEEEFRVRVSPAGQIVGYDHKIEEARAGPSLERAAAETAAQNYLTSKLGMDLSGWDVLPEEANSKKKPNRLDCEFTWEKRGFRAKEAPYRLKVSLLGDRVGGSEEFLKVPEAWQRGFSRMRSGNNTLAGVF